MNLFNLFLEQAARHPQRIALIGDGTSIRYVDLLQRSAALAQRLAAGGLRRGDVALPVLGVGISLYVSVLALFRLGVTALFPEPASGLRGLRAAARAVAVHALIGDWRARMLRFVLPELHSVRIAVAPDAARLDAVSDAVDLPTAAPALITFTSGSTGRPKGIVRSHGFLLEQHVQLSSVLQPQDDDVVLVSLPMFILGNLARGVTSIIPEGDLRHPGKIDPPPVIRQIERHRANRLVLPPALCDCLARSGATLNGVTQVFTGGGPVFPDLLHKLIKLAPNARITAVYGSSEAEPIAHISLDQISVQDFEAMRAGAGLLAGKPVNALGLRIVDDEIWVSGDHVATGYLDAADDGATKRASAGRIWHRTGDCGRIDEHGRLWLLGRHEARSGSLFPFAVETAARSLHGVRNAALLRAGATAVLALEPDGTTPLQFPPGWTRRWSDTLRLVIVPQIPMDRRHRSKVDYGRLRAMLRQRGVADCRCAAPGPRPHNSPGEV